MNTEFQNRIAPADLFHYDNFHSVFGLPLPPSFGQNLVIELAKVSRNFCFRLAQFECKIAGKVFFINRIDVHRTRLGEH